MGASQEVLTLPLDLRAAMMQLDAFRMKGATAFKEGAKALSQAQEVGDKFYQVYEKSTKAVNDLADAYKPLLEKVNAGIQAFKAEGAAIQARGNMMAQMAQWQSSQGPDMRGMMSGWQSGKRNDLLEANAARGSMTDRMSGWQASQGPDTAGMMAKWQSGRDGVLAYQASVEQAMASDDKWNTKKAQLQISFVQLTKQVDIHNQRIRELASAEVVDANAVEMEVRARDKLQTKLILTERAMAGSNAAMRNSRLMTQSASYAIQDFVQGLSVGSFSMAVRGAANNVETLAATMTLGKSAAVAMTASLLPTVALVGVGLYEAFKHTAAETKAATDASKEYRDELERIRNIGADVTQGEYARAVAVEARSYAERRAAISKTGLDASIKAENLRGENIGLIGDNWRSVLGGYEQQLEAKRSAESKKPLHERDNRWANMSLAEFIRSQRGSEGEVAAATNRDKLRAAEAEEAAARARLANLDAEQNKASQRLTIQSLLSKHRGKLTEIAGRARAGGMPAGAIRGTIRDAIGAMPGVGADIADAATDQFMREANVNAAEGKFAAIDNRMKAGVAAAQKNVEAVKAGNKGAWAEDQAKEALANARWPMMLFEAFRQSPPGLLLEMRDILTAIRDGVHGDGAIPQNNVARNNANVWNPMQWLPGVK